MSVTAKHAKIFAHRRFAAAVSCMLRHVNHRRECATASSHSLSDSRGSLPIYLSQNEVPPEWSLKVEHSRIRLENRISYLKVHKIFACGAKKSRLATLAGEFQHVAVSQRGPSPRT